MFQIFKCHITDHLLGVNAHICKVKAERDQINKCKLKWVLEYPNPCDCTDVVIGGFNVWISERRSVPNSADSLLISDDINAIRRHYGLQCDKERKFTNCKPPT